MTNEIPESLRITKDTTVSMDLSQALGFYPRDDYLLVEITDKIRIYDTRKLIAQYSRSHSKNPIAIRGIGGGLTGAIVMTHLIITEEALYSDQLEASTFSVLDPKSDRPKTGIQLVIFPEKKE
jgi:hypothetical protein